jgi:hypothetical protein
LLAAAVHDAETGALELEALRADYLELHFLALVVYDVYQVLFLEVVVALVGNADSLAETEQQLFDRVVADAFELLLFVVVVEFGLVAQSHSQSCIHSLFLLVQDVLHHFDPVQDQRLELIIVMGIGRRRTQLWSVGRVLLLRSLRQLFLREMIIINLKLLRFRTATLRGYGQRLLRQRQAHKIGPQTAPIPISYPLGIPRLPLRRRIIHLIHTTRRHNLINHVIPRGNDPRLIHNHVVQTAQFLQGFGVADFDVELLFDSAGGDEGDDVEEREDYGGA